MKMLIMKVYNLWRFFVSIRRILIGLVAVFVLGFIVIQLIPGFDITNPPVTHTIKWDSPETEQLMRTACYDCHSNETVWPWYSYIAPVKWLVVKDVKEGREEMNLSTMSRLDVREMVEKIERGSMPPAVYLPMHPAASLNAEQKAALIAGIEATAAQ